MNHSMLVTEDITRGSHELESHTW